MSRTRRVSRMALAATIALGVVAVPAAAITAPALLAGAAQSQAAVLPAADSAGVLRLSTTSAVGTVTWNGKQQQLSGGRQCKIVPTAGSDDLLAFTGFMGSTPGTAGFRGGNIGVFEFDGEGDGPNNAAQCSQVDAASFVATETLGLDLGDDLRDVFGPLAATSATVSLIAQSRDGSAAVTLIGANGAPDVTLPTITWKRLKTGAVIDVGGALAGGVDFTFSGIRLKALSGNLSLRGATFTLQSGADGVLGCESANNSASVAASGTGPGVDLTRLPNADGSTCVMVPYTLRATVDGDGVRTVQFLKSLEEQTEAQFILDFVYTVSPANTGVLTSPLLPPTETTIDYEQGTPNEIPLRWCPDVTTDVDGSQTGIANVLTNTAAPDQESALTGKQFTCILSQTATVADGDPDNVTVEQRVYLLGDAAYRFR